MTSFLAFTIVGIVTGCIYALAASGLVVTYTTSGIFNFAHGAIGMVMAFAYWDLRVRHHWPTLLALAAILLVVAPLFGAVVERLLMRRLHGTSTGTSLVVTLGLLLALIGVATTLWDPGVGRTLPEFFAGRHFRLFSVNVSYHYATVVAMAALVALFLRGLFYSTRIGVSMRAVVDDPELAALNGAPPARVAQLSWALGASLAALAGILLAPIVSLEVIGLTFLVVNGFAAAMVGRLKSLPLTFAGAIALGLIEAYTTGYLHLGATLQRVKPSLPTIFLFVVLLVLPVARLRVGRVVGHKAPRVPTLRESLAAAAVFVPVMWFVAGRLPFAGIGLADAGQGLSYALIMLSLVVLTGYGGQVSLCQLTFVGLGSFAMGHFAGGHSPLGVLVAGLVAAPVGAIIALPALRLTGLYLALSTLAFAQLADNLIFQDRHVFDFGGQLRVGRFHLLGVGFTSDRAFFVLLAAAFAIMAIFVLTVRRGPFGRLLAAMGDSPAACATLGLDLTRTKLAVFTLSAAMAGVAGAMFGSLRTSVTANDFIMLNSLALLLLATIGGINTVTGAFLGGMFFAIFPVIQSHVPELRNLTFLGTGLGAMSLGRNPNGVAGLLAPIGETVRERFRRAAPPADHAAPGGAVADRYEPLAGVSA